MRVEHFDAESRKVLVLQEDKPATIEQPPDPTNFKASYEYWCAKYETLHTQAINMPRTKERQQVVLDEARARMNMMKFKHLLPRDARLNAELPDA